MEDEIQLVRGELREDSDEIQEAKRKEWRLTLTLSSEPQYAHSKILIREQNCRAWNSTHIVEREPEERRSWTGWDFEAFRN